MSRTSPVSELNLLENIELDQNYNNTLDFEDATAQYNYFISKKYTSFTQNTGYSYLRDNQPINVQAFIDDLLLVNYLMYKNDDKWYYAFITKKEYINNTMTRIYFKIDVLQTYMFNYSFKESFVEFEHQDRYNSDLEPIFNLQPENYNRGKDFIRKVHTQLADPDRSKLTIDDGTTFQLYWLLVTCSEPISQQEFSNISPYSSTTPKYSSVIVSCTKGMPTNIYSYVIPFPMYYGVVVNPAIFRARSYFMPVGNSLPTFTWAKFLDLTQNPKVMSISISKYCPFNYDVYKDTYTDGYITYDRYTFSPSSQGTSDLYLCSYSEDNKNAMWFIGENQTLGDKSINCLSLDADPVLSINNLKNINYEPKLKTSEYSYLELELGNNKLKLNYEDFASQIDIKIKTSFSVKQGQSIIPLNYKGETEYTDESIDISNIQNEMPLRTDAWRTYLSQNKNSMISGIATSAVQSVAGIGIGLATGGLGFAVAGSQALGAIGQGVNQFARVQDMKNSPDKVNDTQLDLVADYIKKGINIYINRYELRDQFKQLLFEYFHHYGYSSNEFKIPNIKSRYYFNYIKTRGCILSSNIDEEAKQEICNIFDKGVTIWHYRDSQTFKGICNFDYENMEMSLMEE